ncbi:MAG: hypothetical protein WB689_19645 [Xanthobacteraceae bacterium]
MIDRLVPQQAAAQLLANRLVFGQLYNVDMKLDRQQERQAVRHTRQRAF